jgi:hypothetical protein
MRNSRSFDIRDGSIDELPAWALVLPEVLPLVLPLVLPEVLPAVPLVEPVVPLIELPVEDLGTLRRSRAWFT